MTAARRPSTLRLVILGASLLVAAAAVLALERARSGIATERLTIGQTPATLFAPPADRYPVAVVAHGFGGSRQMMEAISLGLARSGIAALAFDFRGHGRHGAPMSPDIARIEGTTADLTAQTLEVIAAARDLPGRVGPVSLVGHSMATDIIVRAAAEAGEPAAAVAAISMYSDAVTPAHPRRLLILSGAFEGRLRSVALAAVAEVRSPAAEGVTVRAGGVARRAAVAPLVGHVGVLWSPATQREILGWLDAPAPRIARTGPWIAALLAAAVVAFGALAGLLGPPRAPAPGPSRRLFLAAALLPAVPAAGAALAAPPLLGLAGFGALALFFGVWGAVQLGLLAAAGQRPARPRIGGAMLVLGGSLVFALALDRYGAAFLPVGPRLPAFGLLALGALPFLLADAVLLRGAPPWRRLAARAVPLAALLAAMLAAPGRVGLVFTVLPVLVLFWVVFGTMGGQAARRADAEGPALALGVVLAWSLAASTPLFAAP